MALARDGYTQEEIQQQLDEKSVRGIEGLLCRWRKKSSRRRRSVRAYAARPSQQASACMWLVSVL
ncbi:hypothetical protein DMH26_42155 [Streptomyces sp. WAC 05379]|nr:hypothetical protein DMH26_42155 [Streptomyces sp. WAC 05379]